MRSLSRLLLLGAVLAFAGWPRSLTAQENGPERIILTGSSLGGVMFLHASHQGMTECASCHHESRPEKPLDTPHQPCAECHTKTPTAPMATSIRDAFHDATAKAGGCVDCHVTEAAAGKTVPLKCTECHKKENM